MIYVTGMHGAGTSSAAKYYAEKHGLMPEYELNIKVLPERALALKDRVLQCPQLAHLSKEFSRKGVVYWMNRDHSSLVKTWIAMRTPHECFAIMKNLNKTFPDDPIWLRLHYDGSDDAYNDYAGYYTLLVKVKDYLMREHLMPYVKVVEAERMPYWTQPTERHFTPGQREAHEAMLRYWDGLAGG